MAFVMVLPWRWLQRKPVRATNFGFFPHGLLAAAHPGDHERLVEDFSSTTNSVAFISQADDIVTKVFSGP